MISTLVFTFADMAQYILKVGHMERHEYNYNLKGYRKSRLNVS